MAEVLPLWRNTPNQSINGIKALKEWDKTNKEVSFLMSNVYIFYVYFFIAEGGGGKLFSPTVIWLRNEPILKLTV